MAQGWTGKSIGLAFIGKNNYHVLYPGPRYNSFSVRSTGVKPSESETMILLMASYGLRACDVVALKLEDILWRNGYLRIRQSKTGNLLELPLTGPVSSAICDYLRKVPRHGGYRQVFLRLRAPGGPLKSTAVIEAFQAWSQKSGLDIPFKGVHCIRHSYAIHLLRRGVSLKSIGDLLGHRSPESTAVYLRLATEDLRTVALPLPPPIPVSQEGRG